MPIAKGTKRTKSAPSTKVQGRKAALKPSAKQKEKTAKVKLSKAEREKRESEAVESIVYGRDAESLALYNIFLNGKGINFSKSGLRLLAESLLKKQSHDEAFLKNFNTVVDLTRVELESAKLELVELKDVICNLADIVPRAFFVSMFAEHLKGVSTPTQRDNLRKMILTVDAIYQEIEEGVLKSPD